MSSAELTKELFTAYNIKYCISDTNSKLVKRLEASVDTTLTDDIIRNFFRSKWSPSPKELHIKNLKSGLLVGHNWHGAMPSMLHLSLQNKVRAHISGEISLEKLIEIGSDIMKHEYFMVCAHDLCETLVIANFPNSIPPIGSKSISDFVFNDIPFDLKITNYFDGQNKKFVNENKEIIAKQLLEGADILRVRKQAKESINNWGYNRFYVLVEDQKRWLEEPEIVLEELLKEIKQLGSPIEIGYNEVIEKGQTLAALKISVHLIAI